MTKGKKIGGGVAVGACVVAFLVFGPIGPVALLLLGAASYGAATVVEKMGKGLVSRHTGTPAGNARDHATRNSRASKRQTKYDAMKARQNGGTGFGSSHTRSSSGQAAAKKTATGKDGWTTTTETRSERARQAAATTKAKGKAAWEKARDSDATAFWAGILGRRKAIADPAEHTTARETDQTVDPAPTATPEPVPAPATTRNTTTREAAMPASNRPASAGQATAGWNQVISEVSDFEPEDHNHLIEFMKGQIGGQCGYADAIEDWYDHCVQGIRLDARSMEGLSDLAEAASEAAMAAARAHDKFVQTYEAIIEFADNGGVLPKDGDFFGGGATNSATSARRTNRAA